MPDGLQSVISEEDEGIMSTGGCIEEDGINQSYVYPSTVRSVKRCLDSFSVTNNDEMETVQIVVDTFTPYNATDSNLNKEETKVQ